MKQSFSPWWRGAAAAVFIWFLLCAPAPAVPVVVFDNGPVGNPPLGGSDISGCGCTPVATANPFTLSAPTTLTAAQNVGIWIEQSADEAPVSLYLLNYYVTAAPFDFDPLIAGIASDSLFGNLNATMVGDDLPFDGSLWDIYNVNFLFDVTSDVVPQLAAGNYWFELAALTDFIPEDPDDPEPFEPRVLWDWVNPQKTPDPNTALIAVFDVDTGEPTGVEPAPANSFQLVAEVEAPELDARTAVLPIASLALLLGMLADRRRRFSIT